MLDKRELKGHMAKNGDTQNGLAEFLGITIQRLSAKMNSKQTSEKVKPAQFTQDEMYRIMKRYHMSPDEFVRTFFADPESIN